MPKLEPYILFTVADTTYGVLSDHIQQMEMIEQITRVPNVPAFVDGIVYLRGKVLPVVNLRARFGLERIPYDLQARLIVVQMGDRLVGMAVDSAREFVRLDSEQIQPPPPALQAEGNRFVAGVIPHQGRLVLILNLEEILSPDEKARLTQTPTTP